MIEYIHFILMNSDTVGTGCLVGSSILVAASHRIECRHCTSSVRRRNRDIVQATLIEFVIQFLHVFLAIQQREIQFSLPTLSRMSSYARTHTHIGQVMPPTPTQTFSLFMIRSTFKIRTQLCNLTTDCQFVSQEIFYFHLLARGTNSGCVTYFTWLLSSFCVLTFSFHSFADELFARKKNMLSFDSPSTIGVYKTCEFNFLSRLQLRDSDGDANSSALCWRELDGPWTSCTNISLIRRAKSSRTEHKFFCCE